MPMYCAHAPYMRIKVGGASLRAISMAAVVSRLFPGHRLHSSFSLRPLSSLSPSLRPAQPSWRRQKSFTRCVSTATARLTARADEADGVGGNPRVLITGGAGQLGRKLAKMMRYVKNTAPSESRRFHVGIANKGDVGRWVPASLL